MRRYAQETTVSPSRSISEIEDMLRKNYGAKSFMYGTHNGCLALIFELNNRRIRFSAPLPTIEDSSRTPTGRVRHSKTIQIKTWEQMTRQTYRALLLSIKGKLESSKSEIESFEEAFMAQTVMPNGKTLSEMVLPQVEQAYATGEMPPLMLTSGNK